MNEQKNFKIVYHLWKFPKTNLKKNERNNGTFLTTTFMIDKQNCLYSTWLFNCWNLKSRFVTNAFWTRFIDSDHSAQLEKSAQSKSL